LYIHAVLILCLTHFFAFRNSDPCRWISVLGWDSNVGCKVKSWKSAAF
jgi:hypothetical protein